GHLEVPDEKDPVQLQWVHGPITVGMGLRPCDLHRGGRVASMGPRSDNRGYAACTRSTWRPRTRFNGATVREPWVCQRSVVGQEVTDRASMGPRSDNRGYDDAGT